MIDQTSSTTQYDPQAVAMARAIKLQESSNNYNTPPEPKGDSLGGAYMFQKPTWQTYAGQILGDPSAEFTPENQDKVAYGMIKAWKDQGLQPAQIAQKWNPGDPTYPNKVVGKLKEIAQQQQPPKLPDAGVGQPTDQQQPITIPQGLNPTMAKAFQSYSQLQTVQNALLDKINTLPANSPQRNALMKTVQENSATLDTQLQALHGFSASGADGSFKDSYGQRLANDLKTAGLNISSAIQNSNQAQGLGNQVKAGLQAGYTAVGQTVGAVFAPIGEAINSLPQVVKDPLGALVDKFFPQQADFNKKAITAWQEQHPQAAENLNNTVNILGAMIGGKMSGETGTLKPDTIGDIIKSAPGDIKRGLANSGIGQEIGSIKAEAKAKANSYIGDAYRETAMKYNAGRNILQTAEVKGSDPIGLMQNYGNELLGGIKMEKGKIIDTSEARATLNQNVHTLGDIKSSLVGAFDEPVPLGDFQNYAEGLVKANPKTSMLPGVQRGMVSEVNGIIDEALGNKMGGGSEIDLGTLGGNAKEQITAQMGGTTELTPAQLDQIKTYAQSKMNPKTSPLGTYSYDAYGYVAKAADDLLKQMGNDTNAAGVLQRINKDLAAHYDAAKLLKSLEGKTPSGGIITSLLKKGANIVTGTVLGVGAGHPVLGLGGGYIAGILEDIISNNMITNPIKATMVSRLASDGIISSEAAASAKAFISQQGAESPIGQSLSSELNKPQQYAPYSPKE